MRTITTPGAHVLLLENLHDQPRYVLGNFLAEWTALLGENGLQRLAVAPYDYNLTLRALALARRVAGTVTRRGRGPMVSADQSIPGRPETSHRTLTARAYAVAVALCGRVDHRLEQMLVGAADGQRAGKTDASAADATRGASRGDERELLLLSPSAGLGGGIERVMDAIDESWEGGVQRVDLLRHVAPGSAARRPDGTVTKAAIARFTANSFKSARTSRPDVVVCGLLGLLPVAASVALAFRSKLALVAHGLEVWGQLRPLERALVRRCSHLLCVSSFTADVLGRRAGLDPGNMRILALPMAEPIAAAAQGKMTAHAERRPVVLTVSRLAAEHRYKGHFDIARCFARVLERRPDATWVVVGDGDDLPTLRDECARLGIQHAVKFKGRISDQELIELYRSVALFALPSFADIDAEPPVGEGFGLVYLEAGAFGLPIIAATPGGGSSDFVIDAETGVTVRPHAPGELADAIVRLLDDPQLRAALGERARSRAFASHLPTHFREVLHRSLA